MVEAYADTEFEITRELQLDCDYTLIDDGYCEWSGALVLDGFEYKGVEYFDWTCPECETEHATEEVVR